MADYQEYRRRVLHRRWRRRFMAAGLLFLLVLLGAVSVMWKRLHRDPAQTRQDTILQEITEDNTWNTSTPWVRSAVARMTSPSFRSSPVIST